MNKDFKERLSFGGQKTGASRRENWREALGLLPDSVEEQKQSDHAARLLPTISEESKGTTYIEWVLTEESNSIRVILVPYFVDGVTSYQVPFLSYLLNQVELSVFDHSWVLFFAENFCQDDVKVELNDRNVIQTVLLTLAGANRLRLASDEIPLRVEKSLALKARLRFSEEWDVWALDAELVDTEAGGSLAPELLDFISNSGLVAYNGGLYSLPVGAAWVAQILVSGAWYIAKENLAEALYHLSRRIHDSKFLRDLSEVQCLQSVPLPVVYLRSKHFDKNAQVTLYLAFRYANCEVFSSWHGQGGEHLPIGFNSGSSDGILHFRDLVSESEMEAQLKREEGVTFAANKRAWRIQVPILWEVIHHLLSLHWEIWAEKHKIEELSSFGVSAESGIGWFELQPFDRYSGQKIDPLQLIKYLKRKSLFIRLGHDRVCVLPERWIEHLTRLLDISHFEEDKGWCFSSLYASEVESTFGDHPEFQADAPFHSTVEKIRSFDRIEPLEQPEGLRALLRPYQLAGLTWLNLLCELRVGGILADDMGLGKTVQVLALLQHRIVNQADLTPQTILVVCPKSVRAHWLAQANNLVPRLKCHILKPRDMAEELDFKEHVLLLASYGLVRHNIDTLSKWKFDLLILDEAQMIKNNSSQTTQAIKKLSAEQRFALTGTPIENRFEELVSIFTFLNPLATLHLGAESPTADALRSLVQRALHPFVLRRLKEDVLTDLPSKTVNEVTLSMAPDQGRLHQELLEIYRAEIAKRQNSDALPTEDEAAFFLEGLLRLRQVATYPQQLVGDQFQSCMSNKREYLCEHIPELIKKGHRIVVFSQFLGFLRSLSQGIKTLDIRHSYVDGETPERDREIALFQSNPAIKVLLISLRVGGIGIDLTSTDVCIIADPWWNDAVEKQAVDRLHRFGQKKPVTVLRLISTGSIEEKMEILKRNKSELVDALGKTNPDFLSHLKWTDFTEVF
jgi:superfamily II DNA or RNA helicase